MAKMIRLTLGCKCGATMQAHCEDRLREQVIGLFREAHQGPDCEPCLAREAATIRRKTCTQAVALGELLPEADKPNLSTDAAPSGEREINTV